MQDRKGIWPELHSTEYAVGRPQSMKHFVVEKTEFQLKLFEARIVLLHFSLTVLAKIKSLRCGFNLLKFLLRMNASVLQSRKERPLFA